MCFPKKMYFPKFECKVTIYNVLSAIYPPIFSKV